MPSEHKIKQSRVDLKNLSKEIIYTVKKNNKILENLSIENNSPYFDFEDHVFNDSLFIDNCHLFPNGESLKAEIIYKNIINILDI